MADEYDPLSLFLQDAPGVTPIPRVNTSPDRRSAITRTLDRAAQRVAETARAEAKRKQNPLSALIDALGLLPGGQPVALAADMAAQGRHPWKRDVGREIDQFAEGVGEAVRDPGAALEVMVSEAPADWLGVGMRGHTRGEKPGGDLLMQLGAALGIANATPKPRPRISAPKAPQPTTASKPLYRDRPMKTRTTPGTRTGAIRIDEAEAARALRELDELGGNAQSARVRVPLADGGEARALVEKARLDGPAGQASWDMNFYGDLGAPRVQLDAPWDARRLALEHELAHIADPSVRRRYEAASSRMKRGAPPSSEPPPDLHTYVNSSHEVTARIREMHRALRDDADFIRGMGKRPRADTVLEALNVEPWMRHGGAKSVATRKRMLRAAQDTIDAIVENRLAEAVPDRRPAWGARKARSGDHSSGALERLRASVGGSNEARSTLDAAQARHGAPSPVRSYRGSHTAPSKTGANTADNLADVFPEDVYDRAVSAQYYGHGIDADADAVAAIASVRGKPDAEIVVYRAVPLDAAAGINPGDWVSITRKYAEQHGDAVLDGKYRIESARVRAGDLANEGDLHEWGWSP